MKIPRGALMVDIADTALSDDDRRRLQHPLAGGVILFARNYKNKKQLSALNKEIHTLRSPPLLVAVDQEGGRVQRFVHEFTRLPSAADYGRLYDESPQAGVDRATCGGFVMAAELKNVGVDLCFAPVVDVAGAGEVIGDRAFHADADVVAALATAFAAGMRAAGMGCVAKHFPGHGGVSGDSHHECPVDQRDMDKVSQRDLVPYRALIKASAGGVMSAHVKFPRIDNALPCYSDFWLRTVLREELKFTGAVFSDDLVMTGAASGGAPVERVERALSAGCDMVLACNDFAFVDEVLANATDIPAANPRIDALFGLTAADGVNLSGGYCNFVEAVAILNP